MILYDVKAERRYHRSLALERSMLLLNHDEEIVNTLMEMTDEARRIVVAEVEEDLEIPVSKRTYPLPFNIA